MSYPNNSNNNSNNSTGAPRSENATQKAIRENVNFLISQLEAGHSETLTAYLNAMSRFRNYSFGNILEIARQRPDATRVAGLYAWNQVGRKVKKGEKGIRILAPIIGVILVIEDTVELHIRKPHVITAEAQLDTYKSTITFDDLLRAVLRHRPDRILVGEVRGVEARTLLDAMNTGHRGTLATIHANSAKEALYRLALLALRGDSSANARNIREEAWRCLDLVVHLAKIDGRRFVREILQVSRI